MAVGPQKKFTVNKVRIHSDKEGGILSHKVKAWLRGLGWEQTTTEGYDHNAASRVERKNRKLSRSFRAALLTCTGGNGYYKEIWDMGYEHIGRTLNFLPEAGESSPVEKLGGRVIDVQKELHCFGSKCRYYIPKELRGGKFDKVCKMGLWAGLEPTVSGGHRVIPIEWDQKFQRWLLLKPVVAKTVQVEDGVYPLRMVPKMNSQVLAFDNFIDQFSSDAVQSEVYILEKILDHREVSGDREYRCKWKGYGKKDATWEPEINLLEYGAVETLEKYKLDNMNRGLINSLIEKYEAEERHPDMLAVRALIKRHRLQGSEDGWLEAYRKELRVVSDKRLIEITGDELDRVMKREKVIRLRMNPEPKKDGRRKMRLLVMGHTEPANVYSGSIDSPVMATDSVRMFVYSGSQGEGEWHDCEDDCIAAADVDTAFLQGEEYLDSEKDRYVSYKAYKGAEMRVFKLKGSLYGQRDAPIRWFRTLVKYLRDDLGYIQSDNDMCVFRHPVTKHRVGIHVDDVLSRGSRKVQEEFYRNLGGRFGLKPPRYVEVDNPVVFLSVRLSKVIDKDGVGWYRMDQTEDVRQFLEDEEFSNLRPVVAPMPDKKLLGLDKTRLNAEKHRRFRSYIGSLQYFAMWTRYDISYSIARLAQCLESPTEGAWKSLMRVIAYLKGTTEYGLSGAVRVGDVLDMYVDADHAGDRDITTRSHTGIVFLLNGVPIHWRSNKQPVTAKSSAESEIYALSTAVQDMRLIIWRGQEQGLEVGFPGIIYVDNAAGVSFQNRTCPETKLRGCFDLREAWVKELQSNNIVRAVKVDTVLNVADMLTKCQDGVTRGRLMRIIEDRVLELLSRSVSQ